MVTDIRMIIKKKYEIVLITYCIAVVKLIKMPDNDNT